MNATDTLKAPPVATPGAGTIAARLAAGLGLRPWPLNDWHPTPLTLFQRREISLDATRSWGHDSVARPES